MQNENTRLGIAKKLIANGTEHSQIVEQLKEIGTTEDDAKLFASQAKVAHDLKRRKRGLFLGSAGLLLLITGFLLTVFLFHANQSIDITLYGMTSLGAVLLLSGMIDLLGW